MKITIEVEPEDLATITDHMMKGAGPEAVSKVWMTVGNQLATQMQAQMLSQMPDAFRQMFKIYGEPSNSPAASKSVSSKKT
jgi:hypothetical protein